MWSHIFLFGNLPRRRPSEFSAILMFEFWREATAASVPVFLCQSGRRRPENVSILSSLMYDLNTLTTYAFILVYLKLSIKHNWLNEENCRRVYTTDLLNSPLPSQHFNFINSVNWKLTKMCSFLRQSMCLIFLVDLGVL